MFSVWSHLRDQAQFSVRDFFRDEGNGAEIPKTVTALTDRGSPNNFSLRFWQERT